MSERIVIGIDGGGTRLRAAIATSRGELLGYGEAGSGNYHDVGASQVRTNIDLAVTRAWTLAPTPPRPVDAIFLGLGSIVTHEDQATIRDVVRALSLAPVNNIDVDHDLRVALMGGLAGAAGVVLIAGTGSVLLWTGQAWSELASRRLRPVVGRSGQQLLAGSTGDDRSCARPRRAREGHDACATALSRRLNCPTSGRFWPGWNCKG